MGRGLTAAEWAAIQDHVRNGGARIIKLRGRSSYQSPARQSVEMLRARIRNGGYDWPCGYYFGDGPYANVMMAADVQFTAAGMVGSIPQGDAEDMTALQDSYQHLRSSATRSSPPASSRPLPGGARPTRTSSARPEPSGAPEARTIPARRRRLRGRPRVIDGAPPQPGSAARRAAPVLNSWSVALATAPAATEPGAGLTALFARGLARRARSAPRGRGGPPRCLAAPPRPG